MENQNTTSPVEQAASVTVQDKNNEEILRAKYDRKIIMDALEKGSLCCLPDASGYADTSRARNIVSNTNYKGVSLLLVKQHAKENGFPTNDYVTFEGVSSMNEKLNLSWNDRMKVIKDSKGVSISYSKETENPDGTKSREPEHVRLFNVAQLENSAKAHDYDVITKHERTEYVKKQVEAEGKNFSPRSSNKEVADIVCSSTKAEEYLGQYFAAVSSGAKFKVSPEQASAFKKNFYDSIYLQNEKGKINPFNLNVICTKANAYCKDYLRNLDGKNVEKQKPQQTQQKKQNQNVDYESPSF